MLKGPIQSLEVSYMVHATEDSAKISAAVTSLFGHLGGEKSDRLEGHFGNPIVRVTYHMTGEDAQRAFQRFASKMDLTLKKRLKVELDEHLDEHFALYLRLDKQRLLSGRLELTNSDTVRVRVKPRLYTAKGGARSLFAGLLS